MKIKSGLRHAYIISSDSEQIREKRALELAMAFVCKDRGDIACGVCSHCRKAEKRIHPDVIEVRAGLTKDGNRKNEIGVNIIRDIVKDAIIMPNEAIRKVYIIFDADYMNEMAQNALLKILEEPTGEAAFILTAEFTGRLLPTVCSRCIMEEIPSLEPNVFETAEEHKIIIESIFEAVGKKSLHRLIEATNQLDELKSEEAMPLMNFGRELAGLAAKGKSGYNISRKKALELYELFSTCVLYLNSNVNVKQVSGLISAGALNTENTK